LHKEKKSGPQPNLQYSITKGCLQEGRIESSEFVIKSPTVVEMSNDNNDDDDDDDHHHHHN
jgi:hypothetical protein